ncbi:hypothetical protein CONPUDRAFT_162687 [Coniophora puteana RWD-64-598 SS2]|uniref:SSD domain-containing protein n=1 Tax=Coniophora puteana (strain RWD-64-598) TaxID=741705 RepID=A0A5M3N286_CONPW|nr:uncharacterized protein CONPUDRAFT_162687 [Coniophora puteana RWD-64-598 SS2]EIW85500.1 hypothetical protein CONPUDRAFT_162687 [Coniophora puteana RWD-64-598 SS2]
MARHNGMMLSYGPSILQRIRALSDHYLRTFGIHCATHQIRLIIISGLVITSLTYPALATYFAHPSYSRLVASSTQGTLDSFLQDHLNGSAYAQRDLADFWHAHPSSIHIRDDELSRARCGNDRTLRVERVFVRTDSADDAGALSTATLLSTLRLEQHLMRNIHDRRLPCLRTGPARDAQCFLLSPTYFWDRDEATLRGDTNISRTLRSPHASGVRVADGVVHLTPQMVFAGRDSYDDVGDDGQGIDFALFLALTFVFPDSDCSDNGGHAAWLDVIRASAEDVAKDMVDVIGEQVSPALISLEYENSLGKAQGLSTIARFLYPAYALFLAYVTWCMRAMHGVHSRMGLTFTALVEITVSTITSLSVCALAGFKITMVPWSLLPIVIIFVGAENMFALVDAVTKTSVTLPVKERIAEGLSRAGKSNTLKVVFYNSVLGVIAALSAGAIRQFCAFAVVVLVAHWFLAHTFFLSVLSIDIQRLELDELLRHNTLAPTTSPSSADAPPLPSGSRVRRLSRRAKDLLKSRASKNISLILLLAITATLYTMTRPSANANPNSALESTPPSSFLRTGLPRRPHDSRNHTAVGHSSSGDDAQDPAWRLWKLLNPSEDVLVHLRVEAPTIVAFHPGPGAGDDADADGAAEGARNTVPERSQQQQQRPRASGRRGRTIQLVWWVTKIFVLPMSATIGALYALLLYLLKDADRLESAPRRSAPLHQRGAAASPASSSSSSSSRLRLNEGLCENGGEDGLEGRAAFSTLPRACASDVERVRVSGDGRVIAAVGIADEVVVWRRDWHLPIRVDAARAFASAGAAAASQSQSQGQGQVQEQAEGAPALAALAVDEAGAFCAVGTAGGMIGVWAVMRGGRGAGGGAAPGAGSPVAMLGVGAGYKEVVELMFVPPSLEERKVKAGPVSQSRPGTPAPAFGEEPPALLAVYANGEVILWRKGRPVHIYASSVETEPLLTPTATMPSAMGIQQDKGQDDTAALASASWATLVKLQDDSVDRILAAFGLADGSLELIEVSASPDSSPPGPGLEPLRCHVPTGSTEDPVACVATAIIPLDDEPHVIIGTATMSGVVELWDASIPTSPSAHPNTNTISVPSTAACIAMLDDAHGRIDQLRVSPPRRDACRFCGAPPADGVLVALSSSSSSSSMSSASGGGGGGGPSVHVYRAHVALQTRRCSCTPTQGLGSLRPRSSAEHGGRHSRRESFANAVSSVAGAGPSGGNGSAVTAVSVKASGAQHESSVPPSPGTSAFPVSGHGIHSRRASEKEKEKERDTLGLGNGHAHGHRRLSENMMLSLPIPNVIDEYAMSTATGRQLVSPLVSRTSPWQSIAVMRVLEARCDRGSWDVADGKVFGVRRVPRTRPRDPLSITTKGAKDKDGRSDGARSQTTAAWAGIAHATLDRWELWAYDPCDGGGALRCSSLAALKDASANARVPSFPWSDSSLSSSARGRPLRLDGGLAESEPPRLPFTRVAPFVAASDALGVAGLGNTVGLFHFSSS